MHKCTNARRDAHGRCFSLWAGVYFGPPVILRVVSLGRVPELLNPVYDTRIRSIANFPLPSSKRLQIALTMVQQSGHKLSLTLLNVSLLYLLLAIAVLSGVAEAVKSSRSERSGVPRTLTLGHLLRPTSVGIFRTPTPVFIVFSSPSLYCGSIRTDYQYGHSKIRSSVCRTPSRDLQVIRD